MNKFIHIFIAVLLTILSVVMVFLTFQQNRSYQQEASVMLSRSGSHMSGTKPVTAVSSQPVALPVRTVRSRTGSSLPKMSFDYTVVSIENSQIKSGSRYTGISSYSGSYSKQSPGIGATAGALPVYSSSYGSVTGINSRYESYRYNNSFRINPYSRQNQGLIAANSENGQSSQSSSALFNSGLLASGTTRQSAGAATMTDPLGIDPGGDPGDPGEMIPVPDGLGVLMLGALFYLLLKLFRHRA